MYSVGKETGEEGWKIQDPVCFSRVSGDFLCRGLVNEKLSLQDIFDLVKLSVRSFESHSYLADIIAAKL